MATRILRRQQSICRAGNYLVPRLAFIFIFGAVLLGSSTKALAQAKQASQERKKTAVNFEDQLIQGELNKPEFFYFLQRKQFNFGRLIKLRENFLLEMKKTTEQIERKGSNL